MYKNLLNDSLIHQEKAKKNSKHYYIELLIKESTNEEYNYKIDKKDKIYFISKNFQSDIYPGFKFKQKKDFRQNQNIIKKVRKYDIINSEKNKFFTFYETIEFNNYIVYTRCMSEKYHAIEMCEKFCVYPKNYNLKNYMDKNHEDYLFKATKNI